MARMRKMGCQPACTKSKGKSKATSILALLRRHRKQAALAPPPTPADYKARKQQLLTAARDATPQPQHAPTLQGLGRQAPMPNLLAKLFPQRSLVLDPGTGAGQRPLASLPGAGEGGHMPTARLCNLSSLPGTGRGNSKTAAVKPQHVEKLEPFQRFLEKAAGLTPGGPAPGAAAPLPAAFPAR